MSWRTPGQLPAKSMEMVCKLAPAATQVNQVSDTDLEHNFSCSKSGHQLTNWCSRLQAVATSDFTPARSGAHRYTASPRFLGSLGFDAYRCPFKRASSREQACCLVSIANLEDDAPTGSVDCCCRIAPFTLSPPGRLLHLFLLHQIGGSSSRPGRATREPFQQGHAFRTNSLQAPDACLGTA